MPKISLLYTSRRANQIMATVNHWVGLASYPNSARLEVVVSIDADYVEGVQLSQDVQDGLIKWVVIDEPYNCVHGWNAAAEASTGDILIAISDDFRAFKGWDQALIDVNPEWWTHDRAIRIRDGYVNTLCTLPIISRVRYKRFGYFYHPSYQSMFCDTELTEKALQDRALIDANLLFEHLHCDNGKRQKDEVDLRHASDTRWRNGQTVFNLRGLRGFPTDAGPVAAKMFQEVELVAYMQCIEDTFCMKEVCVRLLEEGVRRFFIAVPDHYWDGRPVPSKNLHAINQMSVDLTALGATVNLRLFHVEPYIPISPDRLTVETYIRNAALEWIESEGFYHVAVADDDELWRKGLVVKLTNIIMRERPVAVATGMVPVVGVPGWPVNEAKDKALIYVRTDMRFQACRKVWGITRDLLGYNVVHFTACRGTVEEVAAKMRASGHYDDPDYDFESFIQKLPTIGEGTTNVHMYKPHQVWPETRGWSPDEWAEIPDTLKKFVTNAVQHTLPAH